MKHIRPYSLFESKEQPEVRREYYPDGVIMSEHWYLNKGLHREDGPALIDYQEDGKVKREAWFLNDKRHREDGPAQIDYQEDGKVIDELWYLKGKPHREDGPAWIGYWPDGSVNTELWYLNDRLMSRAEWVERTPGLSAEELVQLASEEPDLEVRRAARKNPNFPEDLSAWSINLDDWQ